MEDDPRPQATEPQRGLGIPGLELAERFYHQAIRPLLDTHFPDLPHAAALIGSGSEVLGFDCAPQ